MSFSRNPSKQQHTVLKKDKYVVDLKKLQTVCTRNYGLLLRLLPLQYDLNETWQIDLTNGLYFELSVQEISAYTERFLLTQKKHTLPSLFNMEFELRVYHDAQMIEVISYQKHSRIRANNPYPNEHLHHKDEKLQINLLLKDWLNLAIKHQADSNASVLNTSISE